MAWQFETEIKGPTSIGDLKRWISEIEKDWTLEDEQYLGKLDEQLLLVWLPKQGYVYSSAQFMPEIGGFLLTGLDKDGELLL